MLYYLLHALEAPADKQSDKGLITNFYPVGSACKDYTL